MWSNIHSAVDKILHECEKIKASRTFENVYAPHNTWKSYGIFRRKPIPDLDVCVRFSPVISLFDCDIHT